MSDTTIWCITIEFQITILETSFDDGNIFIEQNNLAYFFFGARRKGFTIFNSYFLSQSVSKTIFFWTKKVFKKPLWDYNFIFKPE